MNISNERPNRQREELRECALGWLDEGMSLFAVSQFTGVPEAQIRQWDRERVKVTNPVMVLMHKGMTCKEIGEELGISENAAHYLVVDTWREEKERDR